MGNLTIAQKAYEEMISHCTEQAPYEACGILAGAGGTATVAYRMTNAERSHVSYMMDSMEQFRVMKDMRASGLAMLAIYHSHPASPAYPSAKDVSLAFYEDVVYVIISLAYNKPEVRGYLINGGEIKKACITITAL